MPERLSNPQKEAQKLRLQRFGGAVITYGVVILATFLVTRLGLGRLSLLQWEGYIGLAAIINLAFLLVFLAGLNRRFKDPSLTQPQIIVSGLWGMIALHALPAARPIVLMFFLPAFSFGMLSLNRRNYLKVVGWVMGCYGALLIFEFTSDRPDFRPEYEIFLYIIFGILLVWFAVFGGFVFDLRRRMKEQNRRILEAKDKISREVEVRRHAEVEKDQLINELQEALANIETLSGLLPICSSCKKIRDDRGYWNQLESYIRDHSKAEFSHGICPECARNLYPDFKIDKNG